MTDEVRAYAGADGALLLSWEADGTARVLESSPAGFAARSLRLSIQVASDEVVTTPFDASHPVSTALSLWMPRPVIATALLGAPDASAAPHAHALLLVWCEPSTVDVDRVRTLHALRGVLLGSATLQQSARVAETRLDALMRAAPHGIVFVSEASALAHVNAEASRLLGIAEGEVETVQLVRAMRALHRAFRNRQQVEAEFVRVLAQPDATIRDWIWEFSNGAFTTLSVSSMPMRDALGRGRLWLFEDITAEGALRRELGQQHERERRREQQRLEALTRFTAGIAHDFSNLLTVIGGSVEMLRELPDRWSRTPRNGSSTDATTESPPDAAQPIASSPDGVTNDRESDLLAIRQATVRANTLLRQLHAFAGDTFAAPQLLALDAVLQQQSAALAATLDDPRQFVLQPDAAGAHVLLDERHLSLALMNFVGNAREHARTGGVITARTSRVHAPASVDGRPGGQRGRYVAVTVGVSSAPHPTEITDDLRVPFEASRSEDARGEFGLGLVAALAEQSGGTFRYRRASGEAPQYVLYLPEAETVPTGTRQVTPALGVASVDDSKAPMLVVDDDAGPRRVVRRLLEREGYPVITAESAAEAWRELEAREGQVAGVISDYLMPGMSGMDLLAQVRARWPALPVVLVSGFTYDDVTGGALRQLRAQFLPKPFTREELLASLRAAAVVATAP